MENFRNILLLCSLLMWIGILAFAWKFSHLKTGFFLMVLVSAVILAGGVLTEPAHIPKYRYGPFFVPGFMMLLLGLGNYISLKKTGKPFTRIPTRYESEFVKVTGFDYLWTFVLGVVGFLGPLLVEDIFLP